MQIVQRIGNEKLWVREKTLFLCSKQTPFSLYQIVFNWVEGLNEEDCVVCFKSTEMEYEVMLILPFC